MVLGRDDTGIENKKARDFEDLQNEIAGRDVGKIARFLSADDPRSAEAKRKQQERRAADTRRFLDLMKDPEYRTLYTELGQRLQDAEQQTDQVIAATEAAISALETEIADMEARAAKGPDGTPVFKTADGRVVDANGEELPIEIAAGIIWPADAPSAEAYSAAQAEHDALRQYLDDLNGYRTDVLGGIRDRHDDTTNPMDKVDLRQSLDDIEAMMPAAPAARITHDVTPTAPTTIPAAFPQIPIGQ
jgi:hypothetical protein